MVEAVEEATHIVYPPPAPNPPDEEYLRPLEVRGKYCLVHTWYYPDRYVSQLLTSSHAGGVANYVVVELTVLGVGLTPTRT